MVDARERSVVASTASGEVRELQIRTRPAVPACTRRPGASCAPQTELVLSRDMSYAENLALAKEQEEALLVPGRCRPTSVGQVMRRLAAVKMD
jgi:LPS-assembly lipoprotein